MSKIQSAAETLCVCILPKLGHSGEFLIADDEGCQITAMFTMPGPVPVRVELPVEAQNEGAAWKLMSATLTAFHAKLKS